MRSAKQISGSQKLAILCIAGLAGLCAEPLDRRVAEWVLESGGRITVSGGRRVLSSIADLPAGDFRLETIDLLGTLVQSGDLRRLNGLQFLRSLSVPPRLWGEGGRNKKSSELEALREITTLELFHVGVTIGRSIALSDEEIGALALSGNLRDLRLASTVVTGVNLDLFPKLRFLDLGHAAASDRSLETVARLT